MKREYPITVEEYLVERGVRGLEQAVERFSTEYHAFQRGELEDVVVGAVGDCWSFQDREIQLKRSFPVTSLGRGKTVMLRDSFLDADKEDVLGKALHDWEVKGCFGLIESMMGLEVALKRLVFAVCVITGVEDVPDRWKNIDLGEDIEFDCLESFVKGYGAAETLADAGIVGFDRVMQVLDAVQRRLFVHCAARSSHKAIAFLCMRDIRDNFLVSGEIVKSTEDEYSVVKSLVAMAEEKKDVLYDGSSVMKIFGQLDGDKESNSNTRGQGTQRGDFSRLCAVLAGYISMASPGGVEAVLFLEQYSQGHRELFLSYVSLVSQVDRASLKEDLLKRCGKKNTWDAKDIMEWVWRCDIRQGDDFVIDSMLHILTSADMARRVCSDGDAFQIEWLMLYLLLARVLDVDGIQDLGSSTLPFNSSENIRKTCMTCWNCLLKSLQNVKMRKLCVDVLQATEPSNPMLGPMSRFASYLIKTCIGSALLVVMLGGTSLGEMGDIELQVANLFIQLASDGHAAEALLFLSKVIDADMNNEDSCIKVLEKLKEVLGLCFSVGTGILEILEKEIGERLLRVERQILSGEDDPKNANVCPHDFPYLCRMLLLVVSTSDFWSEKGHVSASMFKMIEQIAHTIVCFVNASGRHRDASVSVLVQTLNAYRHLVSVSQRTTVFELYLRESSQHEHFFLLCLWLIFAFTEDKITFMDQDQGSIAISENDLQDVANRLLLLQEGIENIQSLGIMTIVAAIYCTWRRSNDMLASIIDSELIAKHLERVTDNATCESSSVPNILKALKSEDFAIDLHAEQIYWFLIPELSVQLNPMDIVIPNIQGCNDILSDIAEDGCRQTKILRPAKILQTNGSFEDVFEFILDNLKLCEESLGKWSKRREKDDLSEFSQHLRENRDEDIPPVIGNMQSHLWSLSNDVQQEIEDDVIQIRHLVCTKYEPFDEKSVAETSAVLDHGEILQPQLKDHNFDEKIKGLRKSIIKTTMEALRSKYIALAALDLYQLEYFSASIAIFSQDQSTYLLADLVTLLVEAILFGRSPILGSSNVLELLESLLRYKRLEMDRNRRNDIVSLAAKSLQGLGRGSPLEPSIGVRLLDILLEPDSMLDTDNLEDFREILYHVCHLAGGNFDSNLSIILTNFDTNRFGTLAAQRTLETDHKTFRTMASGSKTTQFISLVFDLAQWCMKYPVTSSVGVSILEGILSASVERYFCVCLLIVSSRQRFNGEPGIYSKLKEVAGLCQSTNVAVESLRILSSTHPFDSSGDSLGILSSLLKSPAFSTSVGSNASQNSIGWTSSLAPDGEISCNLVQLGHSDKSALVEALNIFIEVYLNSSNVSGVEYKIVVEQKLNYLLSSLQLPRLVEDHPAWGAPWVWRLYRDIMSPHIRNIDKQYDNLGSDVLQSYWDRIPWQLSSFHLDEQVTSLQEIRSLISSSIFPLSLLLRADWSPFLEVVRDGKTKTLHPSTVSECGVVIMYLAISVPDWQLPGWLLNEKGELNTDFLQKISILMDWKYIKDHIAPMRREKPHSWILSPIVSTIASGTKDEVSSRLKRTLLALSRAPSSPEMGEECFDVVFQTLTDVLGFSLCSIVETSSASILPSQSDRMVVPDDIPLELLEGTMEMEQIKTQNASDKHLQESNAVELRSCFRLSVSDHVDIVHSLVSMVQSALDEESMLKNHSGPIWEQSQFRGSIITWDPSSSNFTTIYSKAADLTCGSTVVEALLLALASDPITLMTTKPVPFGSTDPPWFTGDRLFTNISDTDKMDRRYSLKRLLKGISHIGGNDSHSASLNTVNDMESLRICLYKIIEDECIQNDAPNFLSGLGYASLREVLLCDSLEGIPHAHELAEGIIRQVLVHTNPPPISGNTIEEDNSIQMDAFYPDSVSIDRFLRLAHSAAATECPLLSTFLLKQAFHRCATIEKSEWQFTITKVLQTVKVGKKLTMESVLLWLHLLDWLNDPRWRRLPPGSHNDSLNLFLKYLDAVVSHLQLAECSKGGIGTKIARKVSQNIRQHLSSPQQEESSPALVESRIQNETHETHTIMERDGSGSLYEIPLASSHDMSEDEFASSSTTGTRRQKVMKGFKAFGRQMSNIGNKITKAAGSQIKQPSTTLPDRHHDASSTPAENPTPATQSHDDGFDIHLNDVAPIGLAAYAISAYIRTVMEPKLARRTRSADGGSMGHPTIRHIKGTSTLSGSRQMEEEQLLELDTILSARTELDVLSQLKNCSCVTQHALLTEPFFDRMPQLLHVQVAVDDFKVGLISSLITDPMSNRVFHLAFL